MIYWTYIEYTKRIKNFKQLLIFLIYLIVCRDWIVFLFFVPFVVFQVVFSLLDLDTIRFFDIFSIIKQTFFKIKISILVFIIIIVGVKVIQEDGFFLWRSIMFLPTDRDIWVSGGLTFNRKLVTNLGGNLDVGWGSILSCPVFTQ